MDVFFPNMAFGWTFIVALAAIMAVASWLDFRTVIVPKKVSLTLLAVGVLFTLIRCAWLGADGLRAWLFDPTNLGLGLADGFLFALAGFATGFIIFFAMWILNIAGGGDVKVAAGLGAWLGPKYLIGVLILTVPVVVLILIASFLAPLLGFNLNPASLPYDPSTPNHVKRPTRRKMTFSLPLTIATILLVILGFRHELGLMDVPASQPQATVPTSK